jgi:hypothetical protein
MFEVLCQAVCFTRQSANCTACYMWQLTMHFVFTIFNAQQPDMACPLTVLSHASRDTAAISTASARPATPFHLAGTVVNKGSVAFTDVAPNSAAASGMGNGPAAIAWGAEVGSMARSWRPAQPAGLAGRSWDKDV